MPHRVLGFFLAMLAVVSGFAAEPAPESAPVLPAAPAVAPTLAPTPELRASAVNVVVIPVEGTIDTPILYILRRGMKEAIDQGANLVVLDMRTPGGSAGTTLDIMEAIHKFPGQTITFVNDEAGSAGAIIAAVTDDIYFAPTGVMGAAELILGTGQDVGEGLKRKMNSYLGAKIRAFSSGEQRRAQVLEAMMNPEFEFKLDDKVISPKGELLTLTAQEAIAMYGDPPMPLLAAGIAKNIDELLTQRFGAGGYVVKRLEVTWSENLAVFLRKIAPILLGLGLLALYVEFKTPGFGVFGVSGILLLGTVFLSNYVAGLSGHEPVLVFGLGLLLVGIEIFFFPGTVFMALSGLVLMLGSLVWSMADIWPDEPVTFSGDLFLQPMTTLGLGVVIAVALAIGLARFLPRGWVWDKMILNSAVGAAAQDSGGSPQDASGVAAMVGRRGIAATALRPGGQVEIDGRRFEARVEVGSLEAGMPVIVRGRMDFALIVEKADA